MEQTQNKNTRKYLLSVLNKSEGKIYLSYYDVFVVTLKTFEGWDIWDTKGSLKKMIYHHKLQSSLKHN